MLISYNKYFLRCLLVVATTFGVSCAFGVQAPNPRSVSNTPTSARNSDASTVSRTAVRGTNGTNISRVSARGAVVSNAIRGGATTARTALRGATNRAASGRGATNTSARSAVNSSVSRAGIARATAVFNDISKIGGGYAACREAYATCMDQFCANANDKYRRCYCSSRFEDFRETESALDQAKTLLMQFEDNNLNAVDKTAAEVNAMYSATVGEAAIKKDTSAAAKMLDEIGDLLSGKKKASTSTKNSLSMGILSLDITGDIGDVWSSGGESFFTTGSSQNLSELEGVKLYNAASNQCMQLISGSCENSAVTNMARSSYSILITQDCNAYQKNIDKQLENVKQTVRTAEKYLREARLEEYRAHNSDDVNECIGKVRAALTADVACGDGYQRCLDYTGAYINPSTGEPFYSPRLFQLTDLITLAGVDGNMDILSQNPEFNKYLESRKIFANKALDGCRDIAAIVWEEFKRSAIIEIAQAQDEKLESVKMSCVSTMAQCYDRQSSALKEFDDTTAQMAGAISAYAARNMCADKVIACASLYGNTDNCKFDGNGRLTAGNSTSADNINRCGLTALLQFVDTVDNVRISEGCETALKNYATKLCTPDDGSEAYPWNCRFMSSDEIEKNLKTMAETYCSLNVMKKYYDYDSDVKPIVDDLIYDISLQISDTLADKCESTSNGIWYSAEEATDQQYEPEFYRDVYGTTQPPKTERGKGDGRITEYGVCIRNTQKARCDVENKRTGNKGYAKYEEVTKSCIFTKEYYQYQCEQINGIWEENRCYVDEN